jgi:hypothetical protein
MFFNYFAGLLTSPLQPLLTLIKELLSAQVEISIFTSLWAIIIYMLSMFYSLLILYSGFQFIISGHDVVKREKAKEWLRNVLIMIVLVQASYFLYDLAVQLSGVMTSATLNLMGNNLFNANSGGIVGIALQIIFFMFAIIVLITTVLFLVIRYVIVAVGVVLFPIGIFFYFVPFLRHYGLLILNFLGIAMFITFIDAVILIGFSKVMEIAIFSNLQIFLVISAFICIDILMFFLMFFSIIKSAMNVGTKAMAIGTKVAALVG